MGGIAAATGPAPAAQAREASSAGEQGSTVTGGGIGRPITETTASGVSMTISSPQILLSGYSGQLYPQTGRTNLSNGAGASMPKPGWFTPDSSPNGLLFAQPTVWNRTLPYDSPGTEGITLPQSYFNTNQFKDVMRFTVSFNPPIADPVLNMVMFGWIVGWGDNEYVSKPFGKLRIDGATGQNGNSIPVTLSKAAGWDYGGFRFIVRNGTALEEPTPAANLNAHYISGNNYSGGTTAFNSGGQPVSSISFISSSAWANRGGLKTAYATNWGFQLNMPQSVSALTRVTGRSSYGDATHVITNPGVRLGSTVAEGNRTRYTFSANSGTASDNSDSGMDALRGRTLPTASAGSPYTIESIPVSNTSNQAQALQGWIDFNGNGRFDAGEGSQVATISPGQNSASLTWTVPRDVATSGSQALRLRLGPAGQIQNQPTGLAAMGEVEDYPAIVPTQAQATLSVTKTTATSPVVAGSPVTYYLDVRNTSDRTIDNILVNDTIPSQIATFSASGTQGYAYNSSRNFSWFVGTLAPGGTARVTITGTVAASTPAGTTIENTATVTSPQGCAGNNCSSSVRDVVQPGQLSNISVVKSNSLPGSNPIVTPGQAFGYTITVTNNSGQPADNLIITDQLPTGLTYVPVTGDGWTFNGQTGTFTIARLNAGDRQVINLRVRVLATATGVLRNVSVVNGIATVPNCTNTPSMDGCGVDPNPPTVDPAPLIISKLNSKGGGAIEAGTNFSYAITIRNAGSVAAQQIRVTDILPDELDFPAGAQPGWTITGKAAVSDPFDLAPYATRVLTLNVVASRLTPESVINTVMAEKALTGAGFSTLSSPSAQKAAADRIDACVEGTATGACAADSKPITAIKQPALTPAGNTDVWGGGSSQTPTPAATPTPTATPMPAQPAQGPALTGKVVEPSGVWMVPNVFYNVNLQLTNPGNSARSGVTVKALVPDGMTPMPSANPGWSFNGRVATMTNVSVPAFSTVSVGLMAQTPPDANYGKQYPVVFTLDGSDPSSCTKATANCFWAK